MKMMTETWGTHTFIYKINDSCRPYFKSRDYAKFNAKCSTCGIAWQQLSKDYWGETKKMYILKNKLGGVKKIITCNEYLIKNIIE